MDPVDLRGGDDLWFQEKKIRLWSDKLRMCYQFIEGPIILGSQSSR
jgi:hypothetical protein